MQALRNYCQVVRERGVWRWRLESYIQGLGFRLFVLGFRAFRV